MSSFASTPGAPTAKKGSGHRPSSLEPSPASTYGGSVASDAGDDVPATPGDDENGVSLNFNKLSITTNKASSSAGVERYSPPFVRKGAQVRGDDPFVSPASARCASAQVTPAGRKTKGRAALSDNWRPGSSSGGSGSGQSSPSVNAALRSAQRGRGMFVREYADESGSVTAPFPINNANLDVKSEDAQAVYPPSSCVFVANLLQSETDEALEVAVTQAFREYGVVFVKIRRDPKHMPFAFCQYTNDAHAQRAIQDGRGRLIKGRPCRCEKAKAHRLFFFERKYGAVVSPEEVEQLLHTFGRIEFCRSANTVERAAYNLAEGVMVQFAMYDEGQAALQAYRNDDLYKMQSMATLGSPQGQQSRGPSDPANRAYLEAYEVDRRSVFVGNLPADITEPQLHQMFEKYGQIRNVALHKNESVIDVSQKHVFAFVEYVTQPSVTRALEDPVGFFLDGKPVRVVQKDTELAKQRSSRRQQLRTAAPTSAYHSPAARATPVKTQTPSPLATVSPGYNVSIASPYRYAYGSSPMYAYPGCTLFTDGQGQYYSTGTPYSPVSPYFAYTGSPTPVAAGSPPGQPYYGYYQQYATAPFYVGSSPTSQQSAGYYPQVCSSSMTGTAAQNDRAPTPTPARHVLVVNSSMDSQ